MIVGLPCSGKTTFAKILEVEKNALRLTPDEWHRYLYGQDATHPDHDERHEKIEYLQWKVAKAHLILGGDVILDFGFWTKAERQDFKRRAANLDVELKMHYLDVPYEELMIRLEKRNSKASEQVTFIPTSMMSEYLDRFEPPGDEELA